MRPLPMGVRLEAFGVSARQALELAGQAGFTGVMFDAVGELDPKEFSQTGRRHLLHLLNTQQLQLLAIGCPTHNGFDVLDRLEDRLGYTRQVMVLASQMKVPLVINQLGTIPANLDEPQHQHFLAATAQLEESANREGVRFAIRTGANPPAQLATFLQRFPSEAFAVYLDPAGLAWRGHEVYTAVEPLAQWLVAVRIQDLARSGLSVSGYREMPVGQGEMDWQRLLGELAGVDFMGPLIFDSENRTEQGKHLMQGANYLRQLILP